MLVLLVLGVSFVAAFAALVARAIALPRLRAIERVDQIAAYGFPGEARPVEASHAVTGAVQGVAHRVGAYFGGRMRSLSDLRRDLVAAGIYDVSPVTIVGYRILGAAALP